jgi:hypothetical protein
LTVASLSWLSVLVEGCIVWYLRSRVRRCGLETYCRTWGFHSHDWSLLPPAHAGSSLADFSTLKMEAKRSSEITVHTRYTRRNIPEDSILHRNVLFPKPLVNCLHLLIIVWQLEIGVAQYSYRSRWMLPYMINYFPWSFEFIHSTSSKIRSSSKRNNFLRIFNRHPTPSFPLSH